MGDASERTDHQLWLQLLPFYQADGDTPWEGDQPLALPMGVGATALAIANLTSFGPGQYPAHFTSYIDDVFAVTNE